MRPIFSFCVIALALLSCSRSKEDISASKNSFSYNKPCVKYEVNWHEGSKTKAEGKIDSEFINSLASKALSQQLKIYEFVVAGSSNDFTFSEPDTAAKELSVKMIKIALGERKEAESEAVLKPIDLSELQGIIFHEYWNFDANIMKFDKEVVSYTPVRYFEQEIIKQRVASPTFSIHCKKGAAEKLICKDVKYSVSLVNMADGIANGELTTYFPVGIEGLNKGRFFIEVLQKVLSGKQKAYDFFAPVKTELSIKEIRRSLGEKNDTVYKENPTSGEEEKVVEAVMYNRFELTSIYFIEDWYYSPENFSIVKKVKAFAPVREYDGETGQRFKTIPFIIYTGDK